VFGCEDRNDVEKRFLSGIAFNLLRGPVARLEWAPVGVRRARFIWLKHRTASLRSGGGGTHAACAMDDLFADNSVCYCDHAQRHARSRSTIANMGASTQRRAIRGSHVLPNLSMADLELRREFR
jgi:hypothetical protein